jgi:hypothetical protein
VYDRGELEREVVVESARRTVQLAAKALHQVRHLSTRGGGEVALRTQPRQSHLGIAGVIRRVGERRKRVTRASRPEVG